MPRFIFDMPTREAKRLWPVAFPLLGIPFVKKARKKKKARKGKKA